MMCENVVTKKWLKDNFNITKLDNVSLDNVSGMMLGNILWKFVQVNCNEENRHDAYKKAYSYVKNRLPKTTKGSGHATRYFYDINELPTVLSEWYSEYEGKI